MYRDGTGRSSVEGLRCYTFAAARVWLSLRSRYVQTCTDMCMDRCTGRCIGTCIAKLMCKNMDIDPFPDMCLDKDIDMGADMCVDMDTDKCPDTCQDMGIDMDIDMDIDMGADMCIRTCMDMYFGLCSDMCIDMLLSASSCSLTRRHPRQSMTSTAAQRFSSLRTLAKLPLLTLSILTARLSLIIVQTGGAATDRWWPSYWRGVCVPTVLCHSTVRHTTVCFRCRCGARR